MTWLIRAECASISGSINGRRCGASRKASRIFRGRAVDPALPRMIPPALEQPAHLVLQVTSQIWRGLRASRGRALDAFDLCLPVPAHTRHLGEAARVVA